METKLPIHAHELIRLALSDLERTMESDGYKIDMETWHSPKSDGQCHVCFAGAVMAQTMKVPVTLQTAYDGDRYRLIWSSEDARRFVALDEFRQGYITHGLGEIMRTLPPNSPEFCIVQYQNDLLHFPKTSPVEWFGTLREKYRKYERSDFVTWWKVPAFEDSNPEPFMSTMRDMAVYLESMYNQIVEELQL